MMGLIMLPASLCGWCAGLYPWEGRLWSASGVCHALERRNQGGSVMIHTVMSAYNTHAACGTEALFAPCDPDCILPFLHLAVVDKLAAWESS